MGKGDPRGYFFLYKRGEADSWSVPNPHMTGAGVCLLIDCRGSLPLAY